MNRFSTVASLAPKVLACLCVICACAPRPQNTESSGGTSQASVKTDSTAAAKRNGPTSTESKTEPADPVASQKNPTDQVEPPLERRFEYWPDGTTQREWEVRVNVDGNETQHGLETKYYENGQKYMEGPWIDGTRQGAWRTWYTNGQLRGTGYFKNGDKSGEWHRWDEHGIKRGIYNYKNDMLHGPLTKWNENGDMVEQGEFKFGNQDGQWITYDTEGVSTITIWENGKLKNPE